MLNSTWCLQVLSASTWRFGRNIRRPSTYFPGSRYMTHVWTVPQFLSCQSRLWVILLQVIIHKFHLCFMQTRSYCTDGRSIAVLETCFRCTTNAARNRAGCCVNTSSSGNVLSAGLYTYGDWEMSRCLQFQLRDSRQNEDMRSLISDVAMAAQMIHDFTLDNNIMLMPAESREAFVNCIRWGYILSF